MFIPKPTYRDEIQQVTKASQDLSIAVAFWGRNSEKLIAQTASKNIRIICNLLSGGTNPEPIAKLLAMPHVEIRHLSVLHAKVVLGNAAAIVGSANFSTNGVNNEDDEYSGWEEAGYKVDDKIQLESIKSWYDRLWEEAKKISERDLDLAEKLWNSRRKNRAMISDSIGLLNLPLATLRDRAVYIVVYSSYPSEEAIAAYNKAMDKAEAIIGGTSPASELDFYEQAERLPRKAALIGVYIGKRGAVRVEGVSVRVPELDEEYIDNNGDRQKIQVVVNQTQLLDQVFDKSTRQELRRRIEARRVRILELAETLPFDGAVPLYDALASDS